MCYTSSVKWFCARNQASVLFLFRFLLLVLISKSVYASSERKYDDGRLEAKIKVLNKGLITKDKSGKETHIQGKFIKGQDFSISEVTLNYPNRNYKKESFVLYKVEKSDFNPSQRDDTPDFAIDHFFKDIDEHPKFGRKGKFFLGVDPYKEYTLGEFLDTKLGEYCKIIHEKEVKKGNEYFREEVDILNTAKPSKGKKILVEPEESEKSKDKLNPKISMNMEGSSLRMYMGRHSPGDGRIRMLTGTDHMRDSHPLSLRKSMTKHKLRNKERDIRMGIVPKKDTEDKPTTLRDRKIKKLREIADSMKYEEKSFYQSTIDLGSQGISSLRNVLSPVISEEKKQEIKKEKEKKAKYHKERKYFVWPDQCEKLPGGLIIKCVGSLSKRTFDNIINAVDNYNREQLLLDHDQDIFFPTVGSDAYGRAYDAPGKYNKWTKKHERVLEKTSEKRKAERLGREVKKGREEWIARLREVENYRHGHFVDDKKGGIIWRQDRIMKDGRSEGQILEQPWKTYGDESQQQDDLRRQKRNWDYLYIPSKKYKSRRTETKRTKTSWLNQNESKYSKPVERKRIKAIDHQAFVRKLNEACDEQREIEYKKQWTTKLYNLFNRFKKDIRSNFSSEDRQCRKLLDKNKIFESVIAEVNLRAIKMGCNKNEQKIYIDELRDNKIKEFKIAGPKKLIDMLEKASIGDDQHFKMRATNFLAYTILKGANVNYGKWEYKRMQEKEKRKKRGYFHALQKRVSAIHIITTFYITCSIFSSTLIYKAISDNSLLKQSFYKLAASLLLIKKLPLKDLLLLIIPLLPLLASNLLMPKFSLFPTIIINLIFSILSLLATSKILLLTISTLRYNRVNPILTSFCNPILFFTLTITPAVLSSLTRKLLITHIGFTTSFSTILSILSLYPSIAISLAAINYLEENRLIITRIIHALIPLRNVFRN